MAEKKMVNVRLNPGLWGRAKAAAGHRGITLERWMSEAIEAHLDRVDHTPSEAGSTGPTVADLAWRVAALEQAIDYLVSCMGAGLPGAHATSGD